MSDKENKAAGAGRKRINVAEDYETLDWARRLGVSREELREAIRNAGNSAEAVEKYLQARSNHRSHKPPG